MASSGSSSPMGGIPTQQQQSLEEPILLRLEREGLAEYCPKLIHTGGLRTLEDLGYVDDDDLRRIGVDKVFHRRRLLAIGQEVLLAKRASQPQPQQQLVGSTVNPLSFSGVDAHGVVGRTIRSPSSVSSTVSPPTTTESSPRSMTTHQPHHGATLGVPQPMLVGGGPSLLMSSPSPPAPPAAYAAAGLWGSPPHGHGHGSSGGVGGSSLSFGSVGAGGATTAVGSYDVSAGSLAGGGSHFGDYDEDVVEFDRRRRVMEHQQQQQALHQQQQHQQLLQPPSSSSSGNLSVPREYLDGRGSSSRGSMGSSASPAGVTSPSYMPAERPIHGGAGGGGARAGGGTTVPMNPLSNDSMSGGTAAGRTSVVGTSRSTSGSVVASSLGAGTTTTGTRNGGALLSPPPVLVSSQMLPSQRLPQNHHLAAPAPPPPPHPSGINASMTSHALEESYGGHSSIGGFMGATSNGLPSMAAGGRSSTTGTMYHVNAAVGLPSSTTEPISRKVGGDHILIEVLSASHVAPNGGTAGGTGGAGGNGAGGSGDHVNHHHHHHGKGNKGGTGAGRGRGGGTDSPPPAPLGQRDYYCKVSLCDVIENISYPIDSSTQRTPYARGPLPVWSTGMPATSSFGSALSVGGAGAGSRSSPVAGMKFYTSFRHHSVAIELKERHLIGENRHVGVTVFPASFFHTFTAETIVDSWHPMWLLHTDCPEATTASGHDAAHSSHHHHNSSGGGNGADGGGGTTSPSNPNMKDKGSITAYIRLRLSVPGGCPRGVTPGYHVTSVLMYDRTLKLCLFDAQIFRWSQGHRPRDSAAAAATYKDATEGSKKDFASQASTFPTTYMSISLHRGTLPLGDMVAKKGVKVPSPTTTTGGPMSGVGGSSRGTPVKMIEAQMDGTEGGGGGGSSGSLVPRPGSATAQAAASGTRLPSPRDPTSSATAAVVPSSAHLSVPGGAPSGGTRSRGSSGVGTSEYNSALAAAAAENSSSTTRRHSSNNSPAVDGGVGGESVTPPGSDLIRKVHTAAVYQSMQPRFETTFEFTDDVIECKYVTLKLKEVVPRLFFSSPSPPPTTSTSHSKSPQQQQQQAPLTMQDLIEAEDDDDDEDEEEAGGDVDPHHHQHQHHATKRPTPHILQPKADPTTTFSPLTTRRSLIGLLHIPVQYFLAQKEGSAFELEDAFPLTHPKHPEAVAAQVHLRLQVLPREPGMLSASASVAVGPPNQSEPTALSTTTLVVAPGGRSAATTGATATSMPISIAGRLPLHSPADDRGGGEYAAAASVNVVTPPAPGGASRVAAMMMPEDPEEDEEDDQFDSSRPSPPSPWAVKSPSPTHPPVLPMRHRDDFSPPAAAGGGATASSEAGLGRGSSSRGNVLESAAGGTQGAAQRSRSGTATSAAGGTHSVTTPGGGGDLRKEGSVSSQSSSSQQQLQRQGSTTGLNNTNEIQRLLRDEEPPEDEEEEEDEATSSTTSSSNSSSPSSSSSSSSSSSAVSDSEQNSTLGGGGDYQPPPPSPPPPSTHRDPHHSQQQQQGRGGSVKAVPMFGTTGGGGRPKVKATMIYPHAAAAMMLTEEEQEEESGGYADGGEESPTGGARKLQGPNGAATDVRHATHHHPGHRPLSRPSGVVFPPRRAVAGKMMNDEEDDDDDDDKEE